MARDFPTSQIHLVKEQQLEFVPDAPQPRAPFATVLLWSYVRYIPAFQQFLCKTNCLEGFFEVRQSRKFDLYPVFIIAGLLNYLN